MARRKFIAVPATCCNGNCDKTAATAQRMLDAWGSLCEDCSKTGQFTLNAKSMGKIIAAKDETRKLK